MRNFYFLAFFVSIIFAGQINSAPLKVGAYDNSPKIFRNANGDIDGYWFKITEEIGRREGWEIEWVYGSWDECLKRLENREIDIMPDTGVNPEREKKYAFSEETVYLSWTRIYTGSAGEITTVLDLERKKVAGLKNSFDLEGPEGLRKVLKEFSVEAEIIEMSSYNEVFNSVRNNETDAGLVDKDFGIDNESVYSVSPIPVLLQPAKMQFAMDKSSPFSKDILAAIDRRMKELKSDKHSVYYTALEDFFGGKKEHFEIPFWLKFLLSAVFLTIALVAGINLYLRREIRLKTRSLTESEERLRITLQSIGDGVISTDIKGCIVSMNRVAEDLTGWKFPDASGKDLKEVFVIKNAITGKPVINPAESVLCGGKSVGLANHTKLISKNGNEYHISDSAAPITDRNGDVHGVILVFSDVTEKYRNQKKIAENERFLNSLISSLNGMVYRCINDGKWSLVYSTAGSEDITGYSPEELTGGIVRYGELVLPEDVPVLENAIDKAIAGRRGFEVEYRIKDKSGNVKWVLEKARSIYGSRGELKYIEGFITDINTSKTAEMEIRKRSEELERSNRLMVDRELRMIDLKKEINALLKASGSEEKYKIS